MEAVGSNPGEDKTYSHNYFLNIVLKICLSSTCNFRAFFMDPGSGKKSDPDPKHCF